MYVRVDIKENYLEFIVARSQSILHSFLLCSFGSPNQQPIITTNSAIQIGFRTNVPTACAKRPVTSGPTAPPEEPADPIKLMDVIMIFPGSERVKTVWAQG